MPPLFNWLDRRSAGVLLHPTALPGDGGIGTLEPLAVHSFVDFLVEAGCSSWQICPLGPTGYGDSPYQAFSAFAGNPYLIDLSALVHAGLLSSGDLDPVRRLRQDRVDFGGLYQAKWPILAKAHAAFRDGRLPKLPYGDFDEFQQANASWLDSYALFRALKDHFGGRPWWEWPSEAGSFAKAAQSPLREKVARGKDFHAFTQYLFFGQWLQAKSYANRHGVEIIGDLPLYVSRDSADLWSTPELFQLKGKTAEPEFVAGVPPDYFSADGQLWGNPLYDWTAMAKDGYAWWLARLRDAFLIYDIVRIDHFRGFDTYWSIPASAPTARSGEWKEGPGLAFFTAVQQALPNAKIIAEDLGDLKPSVLDLRDASGCPGMAVLQFAFGGKADNCYLPHNLIANSVVYPGTHDNNTTVGWYAEAGEQARDHVRRYLRVNGHDIAWDFIRAAYQSVSRLAVVPMQDFFSLPAHDRFNTPGKPQDNWAWRCSSDQLDRIRGESAGYLRELAAIYGRLTLP
jgi:4-alpha-glucanotransferase